MTLMPYRTFTSGKDRWSLYSPSQTGLWTLSLEDLETGVITSVEHPNKKVRVAAHIAWAGARHSKAPGTGPEIMHEMGMKGVNPDEKLEEMFVNYGHASVGDMARGAGMMVHVDNVPMHFPLAVFNASAVNSGQEKSTRYQKKFGNANLHGLRHYLPEEVLKKHPEFEEEYQKLGALSLQLFNQFKPAITNAFVGYYKPENDKQKSSLDSRVLDCVRFFLLTGQCSGFAFETSARDWSRVISYLKASPFEFYHHVGEQLTQVLTNEEAEKKFGIKHQAPGLLRHSEADDTTNKILDSLESFFHGHFEPKLAGRFASLVEQDVSLIPAEYSEGERVLAQYILTIWHGASRNEVFGFLRGLGDFDIEQTSKLMFGGYDHHHEMPLGEVTRLTAVMESSIGEVRDFNRHRAVGRFIPMPLMFGLPYNGDRAFALLDNGFTLPAYISEILEFRGIKDKMTEAFKGYYEQTERFMRNVYANYGGDIDYGFMVNVLPLATRMDIWMHGDPKQFNYINHLRTRNGGHINYRRLVWKLNQLIADSEPFLSGTRLDAEKMPDPANREQFFDRS